MLAPFLFPLLAAATPYFEIQVIDESTGRGVPLVELETVHHVRFFSDNSGRVAFHEPGLMGREVFFYVRSPGYEYPKDGFGFAGARLRPESGGRAEVKVKRLNVAERLYRITGEGLYRDTVLLGKKSPLREPLINGGVLGQDSTLAVPHDGKIFWFWGDTLRAGYPLGLFRMAGATSKLRRGGGPEPSVGVDLEYFTGPDGFARAMAEVPEKEGLVWIDGICAVPDESGRERLVSHYSRREGLAKALAQGFAVFNDDRNVFEARGTFSLDEKWRFVRAHPVRHSMDGVDYILIGEPFFNTRVKATLGDVLNPAAYETLSGETWSKDGAPAPAPAPPLTDVESGKAVKIHAGSIRWNAHRQRWIMIANEIGGGPSNLGEVWYAEAARPIGPWKKTRRIVTHDHYSFYNPVHHDFFDEDGGRIIYFEGTYSAEFSRDHDLTPRYDYNTIMYRLDLEDPRLAGVRD
jgi:hypothetical protein